MKQLCLFAALGAALITGAAEIQVLPNYQLEVPVTCASPEAARQAELKLLPLPEGKTTAFTCRWDDANARHVRMAALLTKHGYRATFYLTGYDGRFRDTVLPKLIADGHSVGDHTRTHAKLPNLYPGSIANEILNQRIQIECDTDRPVNAFVLPYGSMSSRIAPESTQFIGSALVRAGLLGGADTGKQFYTQGKLRSGDYFTTNLIRPGDRNTSEKKFDSDIARFNHPGPDGTVHMTLGVHTWHSDRDFEVLEKCLMRYAHNPKWFYSNETDYLAYRHLYSRAKIIRRIVDASTVTFTLEVPTPAALGSDIPLWGEVDGHKFAIAHTQKLPVKIDRADKSGIATKFPGVSAKLTPLKAGTIGLEINNTGAPLENVIIVFRLPPVCKPGNPVCEVPHIAGKFVCSVPVETDATVNDGGSQLYAAQIDLIRDGKPGRLWITNLTQKPATTTSPAATAMIAKADFSFDAAAKLSIPGTALDGKFAPADQSPDILPEQITLPRQVRSQLKTPQDQIAVVVEFDGGTGERLRMDFKPVFSVWLNGRRLEPPKSNTTTNLPLPEIKGRCRLLVMIPRGASVPKQVALTVVDSTGTPVEFHRPAPDEKTKR